MALEIAVPEARVLPDGGGAAVDRSFELLALNLSDETNCEGQPWEVVSRNRGVEVWSSAIPGETRRLWRLRVQVTGCFSLEAAREHLTAWPRRRQWDCSVADLSVLASYEGGIELHHSHSKAVGPVTTRDFVDLAQIRESPADGGFHQAGVSVPAEQYPGAPAPSRGAVRGVSKPGNGMRARPSASGEGVWDIDIVVNMDIRGWLPASAFNLAIQGDLASTGKALQQYFAAGLASSDL